MADKKNLKRLKRIVDLQRRIKKHHDWKLSELQHQQTQLVEEKIRLSETLYKPCLSGERFLDLIGHQITRANDEIHRIEAIKEHHQQQRIEQHRRFKYMEKVHDIAIKTYSYEISGQELLEIIDTFQMNKIK